MGSKLSGSLYIRTHEQLSRGHTLQISDCREHGGPVVPTAACEIHHRSHVKPSHGLPPAYDEQGDQGLHLSLRTSWKPFWTLLNFLCSLRHSHTPFPPSFSPFPGVRLALWSEASDTLLGAFVSLSVCFIHFLHSSVLACFLQDLSFHNSLISPHIWFFCT